MISIFKRFFSTKNIPVVQNGTDSALENFIIGLHKSKLTLIKKGIGALNPSDVVLITAFNNDDNFIRIFLEHYKRIGIRKFAFINNNSSDKTDQIIEAFAICQGVHIDIWRTNDKYNGRKMMGWRQRLILHYGLNRWYIIPDSDELLVFDGANINDLIARLERDKMQAAGAVMIDMYSKLPLNRVGKIPPEDILSEYKYFDTNTYKTYFDRRCFVVMGGMRNRIFGLLPWLQKFPVIYAKKDTLGVHSHYWYPYDINQNSKILAALLHYKFLPGDSEKYVAHAKSGIYYNNSSEYKAYVAKIAENPGLSFYDSATSREYKDFDSLKDVIEGINGNYTRFI